jgi:hypothetical protein
MKIVSITIYSNIGYAWMADAIRSCHDHVDAHLVVRFGKKDPIPDDAIKAAGEKLIVVEVSPERVSGGNIRTIGLEEAHRLGFDWGMTLDSDERMHFGDVDIHKELPIIGDGTVLVPAFVEDGSMAPSYSKERFFKLPALDVFTGATHECVVSRMAKQTTIGGVCFSEIQKSGAVYETWCKDVIEILEKEVANGKSDDPRSWYYLGDAYAGIGMDVEAVKAFDKCAALRGWDEESAWACFRIAILLESHGSIHAAVETCAAGLSRFPGMSELAWMAGRLALIEGFPEKAIAWCKMALAVGDSVPRIGWRLPYGMHAGPTQTINEANAAIAAKEA